MSPAATDVRLADAVVHQDTRGGTNQALRALCGSDGGGFAAVWQDQRDGMLGLYLRRIDAAGEPLEPEQPIDEPHVGRGLDPTVALAPDGSGAVAWTAPRPWLPPVAYLRCFDAKGRFLAPNRALSSIAPSEEPGAKPRRGGATKVCAVRRREGNYSVAWTEDGRVKLLETDATGTPSGPPAVLNVPSAGSRAPRAAPGVRLCVERSGGLLCAWKSGDRSLCKLLARGRAESLRADARSCGDGVLEKVEPDPHGGFWALVALDAGFELRHLSPSGEPDRPPVRPFGDAVTGADLAAWRGGLALLGARSTGALEVSWFGFDGRRLEEVPTAVTSSSARSPKDARIASNGAKILVAWTDSRNGDPDVYGRILDPQAAAEVRAGPERRLNSDTVSADQTDPAVAAAGSRAVVAWQDKRDLQPRIYARRVTWPGGFAGDEFQVPASLEGSNVDVPPAARTHAAVSMRAEGDFAVFWIELAEGRASLRAQVFRPDARPATGAILLREVGRAPTRVAAAALPGDRGHLVAWDDLAEPSIWVMRLAPDGRADEPRKIAAGSKGALQGASISLLEGERAIVGWSANPGDPGWVVRARILDLDGAPQGVEMGFDRTLRGQDWDPTFAAAPGGGFLMAWCSGAPSDPGKDVVARLFDARGQPAGPLLPISPLPNEQDHGHVIRLADGTWAVAWEDDISGHDQTYLRRILKNGRELGPTVRINELETSSVPDRQAPVAAALSDGIVALWSDRRRSKGWDVYCKLLGPRFDDVHSR